MNKLFLIWLLIYHVSILSADIPCKLFPDDNIWNVPVDHLQQDANSDLYIKSIGESGTLHSDFGSGEWNGGPIGIPYVVVSGNQPKVEVGFEYSDESDPGPYPIPPNPPIEGGDSSDGDRHILIIDQDHSILYELYNAYPQINGNWKAGSGAIYDLNSNQLRPQTWTSADAAGLPILPGLVRYEEIEAGEITHALRFTVSHTRKDFVWPARHYASSLTGINYPPMGQRFRLKQGFDISSFPKVCQIILTGLKKYGMILADNGSAWFISGVPDERWNNDSLHLLNQVTGTDFEAVDVSSLMIDENSGQTHPLTDIPDFNENSGIRSPMLQSFPNPFQSSARIKYAIAIPGLVEIRIYDILGREIRLLVNEYRQAGVYDTPLVAEYLPNGCYFCRIISGLRSETRKIVLMR